MNPTQFTAAIPAWQLRIRDPYIVACKENQTYYLFGTTDTDPWNGKGEGFLVYESRDLENWSQPRYAFRPEADFWGTHHFWAPEVRFYRGSWYMLASFKADGRCRGVHILKADTVTGPHTPVSAAPVTPGDWECLDGTLYVDKTETPWIVFSHEWTQTGDGEICCRALSEDLICMVTEPAVLFRASQAPWVVSDTGDVAVGQGQNFVTDGPFLYRSRSNRLAMIWSSFSAKGYAIGAAESVSGRITGPWTHHPEPLLEIGGHGMIFETFENQRYLALHSPNTCGNERRKLLRFDL